MEYGFAYIKDGLVINVAAFDSEQPDAEVLAQHLEAFGVDEIVPAQGAGIGWTYSGGVFTAPPVEPFTLSPSLPVPDGVVVDGDVSWEWDEAGMAWVMHVAEPAVEG